MSLAVDVDVIVVGAGPAGATAALNLVPRRRVLVLDRASPQRQRIGEAVPAATKRLLADMGLLSSFLEDGHTPCHVNRSVWGRPDGVETDFIRDPDGHGWHLDRARFDRRLVHAAVSRGAAMLQISRLEGIDVDGARWRVRVRSEDREFELNAEFLIDAGGRSTPVARRLGSRRRRFDRLVCAWTSGIAGRPQIGAGMTYIEAEERGWWYSVPVQEGRRLVALLTDSDLLPVRAGEAASALLARARGCRELASLLADAQFEPSAPIVVTAANSAVLDPCGGENWLAVGDAGVGFDPLSSQGIFHAIYSGLAAAQAVDRRLSGIVGALDEYRSAIERIHAVYRVQLARAYEAERRFAAAPFWRRRHRAPSTLSLRAEGDGPLFGAELS